MWIDRDRFSGMNLGRSTKKIETHWRMHLWRGRLQHRPAQATHCVGAYINVLDLEYFRYSNIKVAVSTGLEINY